MTRRARSDCPASKTHRLAWRLANYQSWLCAICGKPILREAKFGSKRGLSLDHVWPKRPAFQVNLGRYNDLRQPGNAVAAHSGCNSAKGSRRPTGCELIWLAVVNVRRSQQPEPQRIAA